MSAPVPPVTFSAMGSDGRFTVLLSEDVVRGLADAHDDALDYAPDFVQPIAIAAREAIAAHDRDKAKEAFTQALRSLVRDSCYGQTFAIDPERVIHLYDLAKGTEPT